MRRQRPSVGGLSTLQWDKLVLAAYNAGEGAVDRAGRRVPNFAETRIYVQRGMNFLGGQAA